MSVNVYTVYMVSSQLVVNQNWIATGVFMYVLSTHLVESWNSVQHLVCVYILSLQLILSWNWPMKIVAFIHTFTSVGVKLKLINVNLCIYTKFHVSWSQAENEKLNNTISRKVKSRTIYLKLTNCTFVADVSFYLFTKLNYVVVITEQNNSSPQNSVKMCLKHTEHGLDLYQIKQIKGKQTGYFKIYKRF